MITRELIDAGLVLATKEQALKRQLKEVDREIDLFFSGLSKDDIVELLLTWKDLDESSLTLDPINRADYEYRRIYTNRKTDQIYAILATVDNFPEVERVLEEFGYECTGTFNCTSILLWKSGTTTTVKSSFGSYIILPANKANDAIANYDADLFVSRYRKVVSELKMGDNCEADGVLDEQPDKLYTQHSRRTNE